MNTQKKPALALGVVLVLGVLLVLGIRALSSGGARGERGGAQDGKTRGANAALADAAAPSDSTPKAAEEAAAEGTGESRAAIAAAAETKLAAGPRIAGRLHLPPGAPFDESLAVRILHAPYDGDISAWGDPEREEEGEPEFFSRAAVDGEGRFVVDLPPDAREAWIDVDGRFLYLAEPLAVSLAPPPASIELAPELGGWITGRAVPPEGVAATELEGDRIELRPTFSDLDWGSGFGFGRLRARRASLDAEGRFELRGVPPGNEHMVLARPRLLSPVRREDVRSEAGLETQVELALTHGARIAGTVRDENGAPVQGASARVELQEEREGFEGWGRVTLAKQVETGADGAFLIQGAPAGNVQIEATREGWESSETDERELAEGEEVLGLELVVRRGRAIAGRVEWPDGRPAAGAQVFARLGLDAEELREDGEEFDWRRFMELRDKRAVADADGGFLIEGLDERPFDVTALSASPGAEKGAAAEPAETAADGAAGQVTLEGVVPGGAAVKLVLAATPVLHGRVLDEGERPVGAFRVQAEAVEEEEPSFMARMNPEIPPLEFEDLTGAYRVGPLPAGNWRLVVEAEGYARTRTEPFTMPERATAGPLDVVLVLGASVAGVVLAPDGSPAAGASVQSGEGNGWMQRMADEGEETVSARTNTDGRFRLEDLAAGALALTADHEDHAPSAELALTIEPGLRLDDVVLQLRLGGTIEGEIYGQDGKPSAGRMVNCMVPPFGSGRVSKADEGGRFRFEQLEPGSWQVMAMPEQFGRGGEEDMDEDDFFSQMKMATVQVAEGEVVHVVLGAAPANPVRLNGRVRAGEEAISGALVSLVAEGENVLGNLRIARTDDEGAFSVELERPGTYTIQVQIESGNAHAEFVEVVPEAETHHVELDVPVGSIEGRVLGPDGEPRAEVAVRARREGPASAVSLIGLSGEAEHTAEDGTYTLRHLAPGTYTLVAGASEPFEGGGTFGTALLAGVELEEGATLRGVDFRLEEAGRVRGRVVDATGAGVGQAAIFARAANGRAVNPTTYVVSGADGAFLYSNLSPGQYTFSARGAELASLESEPVRVVSGAEAEVTLTAVLGTILVVSSVDGEKEPLPSRVSVTDEAGREMGGLVSLEALMGDFLTSFSLSEHRIGPLPPGTYRVTTVAEDGRSKTRKVSLDGQGERQLKERFRE